MRQTLATVVAAAVIGLTSAVQLKVAGAGNATSPLQYGLMFEDINNSGDGGIYAELVANRAFQTENASVASLYPFRGTTGAKLSLKTVDSRPLSSTLPFSMTVSGPSGYGQTQIGFENPGYWGIEVKPQTYTGTFYVRGAYSGKFTASLKSNSSTQVFASTTITSKSVANKWTQHNFTLIPSKAAPNSNNTLTITFTPSGAANGSLDFNFISLFPPTYNNRPNGMRPDLMKVLKDLNPSFLRMPGGNNLEGYYPYQLRWNDTVGPLIQRKGFPGAWGYYNTNGLGIAEYLNWCVDLAMEPILAVWAGFWLNGPAVSQEDLGFYVQDALNELEYVLGDKSTKYGSLRASHGYPKPWRVNYVEIGNEDNLGGGLDSYASYRFKAFYDAIHKAYPQITLIASTSALKLPSGAMGDYHLYDRPDDLVKQFNLFDGNTSDSKTLIGEYAIIEPNSPTETGPNYSEMRPTYPFWIGTVSEAIFLIGAERNSEAILGASYAPTFMNLNRAQWVPDLISFDADTSQDVLSTSYQMIELFSNTRTTSTMQVGAANASFGPAYWVAGENEKTNSYILKAAVYNTTAAVPFQVSFPNVKGGDSANLTTLTAPDGYSTVTVGSNPVVKTVKTLSADQHGTFSFSLPELSVALLQTETRRSH